MLYAFRYTSGMRNQDRRALPQAVREAIRKRTTNLVLAAKTSNAASESLGVHCSCNHGWAKHLLSNAERLFYLVLDDCPIRRSKKVRDFIEAQDSKLNMCFL